MTRDDPAVCVFAEGEVALVKLVARHEYATKAFGYNPFV